MRLWSLHPSQLDAKGLVALWRAGLLARHVLKGLTKGYKHHPQLERFRRQRDPVLALDSYLSRVVDEADRRGYNFDRGKIRYQKGNRNIRVTDAQLTFEWKHLLKKLWSRDRALHAQLKNSKPRSHPCFRVVQGEIASWERP